MLLLLLHHIAADGWSLAPLARDLARAYAARCGGRAPALPALPVQYADYALWQRERAGRGERSASAIARQLAYWTETLAGLPEQLELPTDRPRPAVASYRGDARAAARSRPSCTARCWRWRGESGATPVHGAAGGAGQRCSRGSARQHDIAVGTPIAGRTDSALDELVGFFVNTLVLRTDTSGQSELPRAARAGARDRAGGLRHQDLPFERLVEVLNPARSLSRHPLFQVMLAFQNNAAGRASSCPG